MNPSFMRNIGAYFACVPGLASVAKTTSTDGSALNGLTFDRNSYAAMLLSCKVSVLCAAVLASDETLTVACALEDSANGSSWAEYSTAAADVVISESGNAVAEFNFDLSGARRYVRPVITPTLSATSADTVTLGAIVNVGGSVELPIV
jgi:hypothetical protein